MDRKPIAIEDFSSPFYHLLEVDWLLLTSGDYETGKYNTMTISWGSLGVMWNRPYAQVVVRPQRYTYEFIEHYDTFTLSAFPKQHRKALSLLGVKSGRDGNKIAEAGLTPCASTCVQAPAFVEAALVIECRKIYWHDIDPGHFLVPGIDNNYPTHDYHRAYYGEILAIEGTDDYRRNG